MAITAEQREARRKYIGSSDAAAIMGLDPYRSAGDIWLEKTGRAEDFEGNENTERGTLLEPVLLDWAEKTIGNPFGRGIMATHYSGLLAANFDGINGGTDDCEPFIVEAKTSVNVDEWGEGGTDQVPERVIIQTHHQMAVAGQFVRIAYVPVLLPGFKAFDWRMYRIQRNDDLADAVAEQGIDFMTNYVQTDTRPDDFKPSIEVLKRVRREPNKVIPVNDELVDAFIVARAIAKKADEEKDAAEAALLAALGDAEGGTYSKGELIYMQTKRKGYAVAETTYRTLRIKSNKEPK